MVEILGMYINLAIYFTTYLLGDHFKHQKVDHLDHQRMRPLGFNLGTRSCTHLRTRNFTHLRCARRNISLTCAPMVGWVGWGGIITSMFLRTHRHSNLIIFPAVVQTQALHMTLHWHESVPFMHPAIPRQPWIAMLTCMYLCLCMRHCVYVHACYHACNPWSSMHVFMSVCIFVSPVSESYVYVCMSVCMQVGM